MNLFLQDSIKGMNGGAWPRKKKKKKKNQSIAANGRVYGEKLEKDLGGLFEILSLLCRQTLWKKKKGGVFLGWCLYERFICYSPRFTHGDFGIFSCETKILHVGNEDQGGRFVLESSDERACLKSELRKRKV